jgi:NAD(P)-dependent dehydrogenase (short-subunit alcohol dehydrogenase family)
MLKGLYGIGILGGVDFGAYSASKFAVRGLTQCAGMSNPFVFYFPLLS